MSYMEHVSSDLRGGRQSWRVLSLLWSVAFVLSIAASAIVVRW